MTTNWQQQIKAGETERLEIKSKPEMDQVGATVCAFLNSGGGILVLGVTETEVIGLDTPEKTRNAILKYLNDNLSPTTAYSITLETLEGKSCLVIDIPAGSELPYLYDSRIYLRRGNASVRASSSEITRLIIRRQQGAIRWERYPALGAEISDLNTEEIKFMGQEMQRDHYMSVSPSTPETVLRRLDLMEGDSLRNSAVVLFGREPQRLFPQMRIRAVHVAEEGRSAFLDSRYLEGNAFQLLQQLESFLKQHVPISSQIPRDRLARIDHPAYPFLAVREAILNAIVHRDYAAYNGGMSVALYSDRMEIENSGQLPPGLSVQGLKEAHSSHAHNPDIAFVFFLRGLIERFGTGTQRIVSACRDWGLPDPEWEERNRNIKLTLRLVPASPNVSQRPLNEYQLRLLKFLPEYGRITAQQYHAQFAVEVSDRQARTHLNQLVEQEFLHREGNGPQTAYVRTEKQRLMDRARI